MIPFPEEDLDNEARTWQQQDDFGKASACIGLEYEPSRQCLFL